ncbi:MAG TPA: divalent metal cation transporter [Terriglobales bacterium]|nr:divalent metal cation transporter [Terriglobales bacterium]
MNGEIIDQVSQPTGRSGSMHRYVAPLHSRMRSALGLLGPSIITGAANDDPCAIGTYAKTGAAFGFATLWVVPVVFPMMAATVYLSSKIGMVSGMGIGGVVRNYYSRWLIYPLVISLLAANIIGAGADIGAVAASLRLLIPVPVPAIIITITFAIIALLAWGSFARLQKTFKWLALALFAYVGAGLLAKPDWGTVVSATLYPKVHFTTSYLATLVAMVGTSLSPYLFFWQASQEVEEEIAIGRTHVWQRRGTSDLELRYAALDVNTGMFFSTLIMYFVILCTAATLFHGGRTSIDSAYAAAQALRPLAGNAAAILFAAGIVGVGILAVPVLTTGPAYALAEAFGWKHSLDHRPEHAQEFYAVIILSTLVAMGLNFIGINPMDALFWAGVIEGLLAPVIMVVIMLITNNREIMGQRVNGRALNILGWTAALITSIAAISLVCSWLL